MNDACTFLAMGVFSDSSLTTSAASFLRSRSTGAGSWSDLDLALELRPESLERDRVLRVEVREAVDLDGRGGMVERPPQIDRERLVRLLVEAELAHGAGLVPARVVVVARGLVEAQLHVVVRPDPFGGVDHAPLERGVDLGGRGEDRRAARPGVDLAAEVRRCAS